MVIFDSYWNLIMSFNQEKPQETTTPVQPALTSTTSYRVPGKLVSSITRQI